MHILRRMGSKLYVKFQRAPLTFHTRFSTQTPQNMHFTVLLFFVWVTISFNWDVISLSETGPGTCHDSTQPRSLFLSTRYVDHNRVHKYFWFNTTDFIHGYWCAGELVYITIRTMHKNTSCVLGEQNCYKLYNWIQHNNSIGTHTKHT